jgi:DNA polymerase-4
MKDRKIKTLKTILHIDLNSYFATVEQQQNPFLRGKPVGIVKDLGRMCIIAASKEAKALGIKTGTGVPEAKKLAPKLILIKADFSKYKNYTQRFYKLIKAFSPEVNLFSLDEAFVEATQCLSLYDSAENLAILIQKHIYKDMGNWVTASVGISHNRMLAKLAGEYAPKGSYFRISQENLDSVLSNCKFTDICGIGYRLAEKLKNTGISNILQLRDLDGRALKARFGVFWGPELKRIAYGKESHVLTLLDTNQQMKGVGRTITAFKLCDDEQEIRQTIRNIIEEASLKIREMNMAGRHLSIFLEGEDQFWHRHRTLKHYVRHPDEIFSILYDGFYKKWQRRFKIIRFGVRIDTLKPFYELTQCWLPAWKKREKVWKAVDAVNHKYGLFSLRSATLLKANIIRPEVTGFLGDKLYLFPGYLKK